MSGAGARYVFLVGTRWFGVLGPCKLLIEELIARNIKVYVFGRHDEHYGQFYMNNVKLVSLKVRRRYISVFADMYDIIKLAWYVIRLKPIVVHSFNPKPSLICFFSLLLAPKIKFLMGVTGMGNTFVKAKLMKPVVLRVMRSAADRADHIFFQNKDDKLFFEKEFAVKQEKTMIFPGPGVDTQRFKVGERRSIPDKIRVLLVARMIWQKGIDDFVETIKLLKKIDLLKHYEFTLVGELDFEHPDRLVADDIDEIVDMGVNWIQWTDEIENVYAENDVLLFMSKREGAPRAILEASATGLPTIGSNCVGVKELILSGITGFVVAPGDIGSIIQKLEHYRKNPNLLTKHGASARKEIAEKFSLENATKAQLAMYDCVEEI